MTGKEWFTLKEVEELTDIAFNTLRTKAQRGEMPVSIQMQGKKPVRLVSWATLDSLRNNAGANDYQRLFGQYLGELRGGVITRKPCSARHLEGVEYSMERYWYHLKEKPSLARVSDEGYRAVVMAIGVDDKKKRDYHGAKLHIFKAVTGFMRLLVRDGYKTEADLLAIKSLKPGRKYTSQTTEYPDAAAVKAVIADNLTRTRGRRPFDIHLMNTLLHLYAYTGIRRMEAAALEVKDIDLEAGSLLVWGKGGKRRRIPIAPPLKPVLEAWLGQWRPACDDPWLLLQQNGMPLTMTSIDNRFHRLSRRGVKIKPHGLRHACATILANEGMPVPLISLMLGHSDVRITNLYMNPTEKDLFKYMHGETFEPKDAGPPATKGDRLDDFVPMF